MTRVALMPSMPMQMTGPCWGQIFRCKKVSWLPSVSNTDTLRVIHYVGYAPRGRVEPKMTELWLRLAAEVSASNVPSQKRETSRHDAWSPSTLNSNPDPGHGACLGLLHPNNRAHHATMDERGTMMQDAKAIHIQP